MGKRKTVTIVDANGREWIVHDFTLVDGKTVMNDVGEGRQRIFVPTDGGARRYHPLYERERLRGASVEVLLDQLSRNWLWSSDDPHYCRQFANRKPERVDPSDAVDPTRSHP